MGLFRLFRQARENARQKREQHDALIRREKEERDYWESQRASILERAERQRDTPHNPNATWIGQCKQGHLYSAEPTANDPRGKPGSNHCIICAGMWYGGSRRFEKRPFTARTVLVWKRRKPVPLPKVMEYKGYKGTVRYDAEEECYAGKLKNVRDKTVPAEVIQYEGYDLDELEDDFQKTVDEYITWKGKAETSPRRVDPIGPQKDQA